MSKHMSVLRGFTIEDDCYGEGAHLAHSNGDCDWRGDAYYRTLTEHARVCDGRPQPKPERSPTSSGNLVSGIWGKMLLEYVGRLLLVGRPVTADGTADQMLIAADQAIDVAVASGD